MTKEELFSLLKEMGVSPKRSLGQNFLVGDHVVERILAQTSQWLKQESITWGLEIGPGLGALTRQLLEIVPQFSVIELDRCFSEYWRQQGLRVFEGDALKLDWNPICSNEGHGILVSNLPYQISSSLVIERSVHPMGFKAMVLMFQKEVAQKIMAERGAKDYGILSVIAQSFWSIHRVTDAARGDFYPPPNVSSRVLGFLHLDDVQLNEREIYLQFVKAAFSHRRKLMVKNMQPFLQKHGLNSEKFCDILGELGYTQMCRAQEITVEDYRRIFARIF